EWPARFELLYEVRDMEKLRDLRVRAFVDGEPPEIDSVHDLFPPANWDERETYDLFGIVFSGHPELTRILMPDDWVGYPLRHDYLSPPINNLAYALAVERLMGVEVPPRAQALRVIMCELTRLSSHLVWLGTSGIELGAMSVLMYCFRERDTIMDMNEEISGFRMHTSYIRPGGVMADATP